MTNDNLPADPVVNHKEAMELASFKRHVSNMARCYIDLRNRLARINSINDNPARFDTEIDELSTVEPRS